MQRSSTATEVERYALLPIRELSDDPKELDSVSIIDTEPSSPRWIRLCAFASIALAVLSCFIPDSQPASLPNAVFPSRVARLAHAATLPRPPMYIGLSRLNHTTALAALPDELVYFPHMFAPISQSEPDKVWPTDGRERRTFNGVVSPGEPRIIIDHSTGTSMIMQLRVQDYGMERCTISAILPWPSDSQLKEQNRTLILSSARTRLDIWRLETRGDVELDLTSLNWYTRPARSSLIATIDARAGRETRTPEFDCGASGSLQTYEISCAEPIDEDEACRIEFWQEQPETVPRMGKDTLLCMDMLMTDAYPVAFVVVQMPSL
ncbi:hypothetical protein ACEPAI_4295 [Sanghuangporus weigelae]